jgi:hypothetical protein
LSFIRRGSDRESVDGGKYEIYIQNGKNIVKCTAIADTGNSAADLSGTPVVFIDKIGGMKLLDSDSSEYSEDYEEMLMKFMHRQFKLKLIPCSTIGGKELIPVLKPKEVVIKEVLKNKSCKVDVLLGIINSTEQKAIFNPKIMM